MNIYVTAQRWTKPLIDNLVGRATGIILGDLFCQKRMFDHDWFDIAKMARHAQQQGLNVVVQSPMYNTARTMETTISLIRNLHANDLADAVLVHDIGVLQTVNQFEGLAMWWDRHAFNRDFIPNAYLIDFLLAEGVSKIEVFRPADVQAIAEQGCEVLLYGYGPNIASFGRVCYTEYFLNEPCERKILCGSHNPFIASVDKVPLQYMADGYTLLDKTDPQHTFPQLSSTQATQVTGVTVYIRSQRELTVIEEIKASFRATVDTTSES